MAQNLDNLPEILCTDPKDSAASKRIRRLAESGRLRKLYAGVYTSNLSGTPESVVLRNWLAIVGNLLPGGVISHRSAFDAQPHDGHLVITRGKTRRDLILPGLTVRIVPGSGPRTDMPANDMPYSNLYLAGEPRRYLENLTRGRGWSERVLPQGEVENFLEKTLAIRGEHQLNIIRDHARTIAKTLDLDTEFSRLDALIGALLGTHSAKKLTARQALARAAGRPYDSGRLNIFDALVSELNRTPFATTPDKSPNGIGRENFGFFEAYFSNYIEGTTFTVEEAESIVFERRIIENRSEDSHDILGTYIAATMPPWRDHPPKTGDAFLLWLKNVNAIVMQARADKKPGEWKDKPNQAGNTLFVIPELVQGTLREGFARIKALADPMARAIMTMFVVAEVHPFLDGNGRTARLAMNCVLTSENLSRIIIPTVYREDYLLPLKLASHDNRPGPLIKALCRAQAWTAAFNYEQPRHLVREALTACNAFQEDLRNYKLIFPDAPISG